ncbi:unnamed protein product [Mytilus coruscus]|uniref:Ig-like domain-containing protein n=1 Tax=Mytilus coruscus TaxID=42192 RepID=A0A6J8CCF2_MYTCO|nr:unnamed protein product [Mytilus coruscus]
MEATHIDGILGQTSLQLRCSYTTVTGEIVTGVNMQAKINKQFRNIATFFTPEVPLNASLTTDGNYLANRVTLTNPTTSSTDSAIIQFSQIACERHSPHQMTLQLPKRSTCKRKRTRRLGELMGNIGNSDLGVDVPYIAIPLPNSNTDSSNPDVPNTDSESKDVNTSDLTLIPALTNWSQSVNSMLPPTQSNNTFDATDMTAPSQSHTSNMNVNPSSESSNPSCSNNNSSTDTSSTDLGQGLSRPLALGVDPKLKAGISSNKFTNLEDLLKSKSRVVKYVPVEKGNPEQPDSVPVYVPSAGIEKGNNVVFTCTGNVGKPQGKFRWVRYRRNSNGITIQETPYESQNTTAVEIPGNCTFNGISHLTLKMEQLDNNAVVRCQVIYQDVPQELLYKQTNGINVYYSVRNVKVSKSPTNPSFAEGAGPITLTCTSDGNPTVTGYTWYKESNTSVSLGTGPTYVINNVVMNETDNYICVAQNSFNGQTFNMNNSIHIQIDITTTTDTTTMTITKIVTTSTNHKTSSMKTEKGKTQRIYC